ncbi:synaptonemal complex central element protein 2 isoform X2 [Fukomys damarensis]|uniref:synaptonemal complex central element protein 2 isoform X2 n=1 Tax=Fukomys damarensis TaxID=885580 RepID=UPI0008FF78F0|nr:synaptonemal complex central element protein 2 isoform X2 [Fukomys damarensis]
MERLEADQARAELSDQALPAVAEGEEQLICEDSCATEKPGGGLARIDILKKRAQDLIENINENRQKDHALMTNFRDSLKVKVSNLTEKLEDRIYQVYSYDSKIIQERLEEFTQKMLQISHLEMELKEACHTVESVYRDLCMQPEATTLEEQTYKDLEC